MIIRRTLLRIPKTKNKQRNEMRVRLRQIILTRILCAYLPQFPSLVPEFEAQYDAFKKTLPGTVEIIDGGMVTTKEQAMEAGDKFRAADVDLVFLQMLT